MRKGRRFGILISISLLLSACGTISTTEETGPNEAEAEAPPPDMNGFVMDQDKDRILVVAPMDDESDQKGRAMWVSGAPGDYVWLGKQVEVWVDGGIAESYPEQAKAEKVEELEMSEVEGADLKASEALSTALSEVDTEQKGVLSVSLLAFDKENDQWTVKLDYRGSSQEEWKTIVDDEK
ncbi:Protein of unknown function [Halobacillus karajensis]|uniref:DUF3221 domain-containing protein n=1 Tax=Halobacillus karajensis TaxID=195088 RepID=UPI0008A75094|nr:DUF3221 domain-containing protein [Halobacillus karajensis]SEH49142.1 Protein of unknown function [Halobacillus karajensis]